MRRKILCALSFRVPLLYDATTAGPVPTPWALSENQLIAVLEQSDGKNKFQRSGGCARIQFYQGTRLAITRDQGQITLLGRNHHCQQKDWRGPDTGI